MMFVCFFFQAEDGIRDSSVTVVQTCALPILCVCVCVCHYISALHLLDGQKQLRASGFPSSSPEASLSFSGSSTTTSVCVCVCICVCVGVWVGVWRCTR